ncbi:MAG: DUF1565 domain-containing protein [Prochloron sp. SP5CPC1]|nr:DUF1565 domain-containing protein [Candidatus Paraprochloron terpiosi SP5CPC1]
MLKLLGYILVFNSMAYAQTIQPQVGDQSQRLTKNAIYVNPTTGSAMGKGSLDSPYHTITQALRVAQPGTRIILAPGLYSAQTGEQFPLILSNNISIIGKINDNNIIITGSGTLFSYTAGEEIQAVVVVTEGAGKLRGVTIINEDDLSYGLWIESASPQVTNNIFNGRGKGGIFVSGHSEPIITHNYFYNMGNGLVVAGTSTPQVRQNTFNNTNYGVRVLENGAPILTSNRITGNKIGVFLEGSAQAILRQNTIDTSLTFGIVAQDNAVVDLGSRNDPGGNIFYGNGTMDISNLVPHHSIAAFGNQLEKGFSGAVDLAATGEPGNGLNSMAIDIPVPPPETSLPKPPPTPSTVSPGRKTLAELLVLSPRSIPDIRDFSPLLFDSKPIPIDNIGYGNINPQDYLVMVDTFNSQHEEELVAIYPHVMPKMFNGQSMWQVGVFSSLESASLVLQNLNSFGFSGLIIRQEELERYERIIQESQEEATEEL